jgi:mxaJ protein
MGVPSGFDRVLTTRPYYRSTYVFVSRPGAEKVNSFDDPRLRDQIIGVQLIGDDAYNAPPAHALSARGMINNIRGFTVYGDYGQDSPPSAIIKAVAAHEIDLAVAWGPMAGFFAPRQQPPLDIVPVSPESDGPSRPLTFAIAVGVRRGNAALKDEIQSALDRRQTDVDAILDEFHVPRLALRAPKSEVNHVAAK